MMVGVAWKIATALQPEFELGGLGARVKGVDGRSNVVLSSIPSPVRYYGWNLWLVDCTWT